jgi:hypothetical protein
MELVVNYLLWIVAAVGVSVPLCGLGAAPGIVVHLVTTAFGANLVEQLENEGFIKTK